MKMMFRMNKIPFGFEHQCCCFSMLIKTEEPVHPLRVYSLTEYSPGKQKDTKFEIRFRIVEE